MELELDLHHYPLPTKESVRERERERERTDVALAHMRCCEFAVASTRNFQWNDLP